MQSEQAFLLAGWLWKVAARRIDVELVHVRRLMDCEDALGHASTVTGNLPKLLGMRQQKCLSWLWQLLEGFIQHTLEYFNLGGGCTALRDTSLHVFRHGLRPMTVVDVSPELGTGI